MVKIDNRTLEEAQLLMDPIRFRIAELLAERPMHINEMSRVMEIERRFLTYHLNVLERCGFVSSKYVISDQRKSKGKALRVFEVTTKALKLIEGIKKGL